jgi:undecaprenyl-diphosphatase
MTILQAILLGIVQGITEFLPISSSGHLVLIPWILGWDFDLGTAFVFDVLVQWGTTLAVIIYFWKDLWHMFIEAARNLLKGTPFATGNSRLAWLILLASIPAAIAGMLLKDLVAAAFINPLASSIALLLTAGLMAWAEHGAVLRKRLFATTWVDATWIGAFQVLALFPGISRSGATISAGLWRGLKRQDAARFSFFMPDPGAQIGPLIAGFISAFIVGMLSIHWLLRYLTRKPLRVFVIYCTVVGLGGIALYVLLH